MDDRQLLRYSRHLLLDALGIEAQSRLLAAHVLIVGAGGLGCTAAIYLAASGVGQITIADGDCVDATNLQRQVLYRESDIGQPKAQVAQRVLQAMNPDVRVNPVVARLAGAALDTAIAAADVVLDCSDNFATRHAINRACVQHRVPLVSGAAIRFDGQLAVFDSRKENAACYACLFAEDTQAEDVACATLGVLSPLTGTIGAMQATEAIKQLTGAGKTLSSRLQLYDALSAEWRTIGIPRDPACAVCGASSIHRR